MFTALVEKIGSLPRETYVYCGHEYTEKNLLFAQAAEPGNAAITEKLARVRATRSSGQPTVPSTLADEWETNPFMRCREPSLLSYTGETDPVTCLGVIRARKSAWRP